MQRVLLFLTLGMGLALKLVFFGGPAGSDDVRYVQFAEYIVTFQTFSQLDHAAGRMLFLWLIGIPIQVGGEALYGALAGVFYAMLLEILVVFVCLRFLDVRAALVAAVVMSFSAIQATYAGMILPDVLCALFALGATAIVMEVLHRNPHARLVPLAFGAGVCLGLSYSVKDTGILFTVPLGVLLLYHLRLKGALLASALSAGFLLVIAVEMLAYEYYTGTPLYRWTALSGLHNEGIQVELGLNDFPFHKLIYWRFLSILSSPLQIAHFLVIAIGAVFAITSQRRILSVAGWSTVFVTGYLLVGSSSFSRYLLLPYQERYLLVVMPLAAVCMGAAVSHHYRWLVTTLRRPILVLASAFFLLCLFTAPSRTGTLYYGSMVYQVSMALEHVPADAKVFIHPDILRSVLYWLPTDSRLRVAPIPANWNDSLPLGFYIPRWHRPLEDGGGVPREGEGDETWPQLSEVMRFQGTKGGLGAFPMKGDGYLPVYVLLP